MALCIDCGLWVNGAGKLEVKRHPNNSIGCDASGLYVNFPAATATADSNTIDFTSNSPIQGNVRQSSQGCNGLRLDGDGVWAPKSCTIAGNANTGYAGANLGTPPYTALNTGGAALFTITSFGGPISIYNPTDCRLIGMWNVQAFGGTVAGNPDFDAYAYVTVNMNGLGWVASTPITYFRMDNRASSAGDPNGGVVNYGINNMWEENFVTFDPGQTNTIEAAINIKVTNGTGVWHEIPFAPGFEFHWHVTPQGVC